MNSSAILPVWSEFTGTDWDENTKLSDRIYRFTPMIMTAEERATVHGTDESISERALLNMIRFYIKFIEGL